MGFELSDPALERVVRYFTNPGEERGATRGSTISEIRLTLVLVGMMQRRFSQSETALSLEKTKSDQLVGADAIPIAAVGTCNPGGVARHDGWCRWCRRSLPSQKP